jgi:hypothetical protein
MLNMMEESAKCANLRNAALDGIEALLDAIGTVADGSDEPGDIVDDGLRTEFMDDLDAIMEVRSNIEHPVFNKYTDAEFHFSEVRPGRHTPRQRWQPSKEEA